MGVRCDDCGAQLLPGWTSDCPYCEAERLGRFRQKMIDAGLGDPCEPLPGLEDLKFKDAEPGPYRYEPRFKLEFPDD